MSKVIKQMELDDLRSTFKDVRDLVVLSTEKLDSLGDYTLRKTLRAQKIRLKVVKNTLTRKVFKENNFSIPDNSDYWKKPTTLAFGPGSIAQVSKAIDAELRNPKLAAMYKDKVVVKGAIADGQPVTFDVAKSMPTREDLIAQIVGMILGPGSAIAGCLTGPAASVASQIATLADKKEEDAPAA
ncbi:MAG: 50S ribosomal protein L10 [Gemmataceae bacterium]